MGLYIYFKESGNELSYSGWDDHLKNEHNYSFAVLCLHIYHAHLDCFLQCLNQ